VEENRNRGKGRATGPPGAKTWRRPCIQHEMLHSSFAYNASRQLLVKPMFTSTFITLTTTLFLFKLLQRQILSCFPPFFNTTSMSYHTSISRDLTNSPTVSEALSVVLSDVVSVYLSVGQSDGQSVGVSEGQFDRHYDGQQTHQRTVRRTIRPCKRYIICKTNQLYSMSV
jgi:hypothetical protein